jgi:DNA-binding NarL/FixJ family response regulator
VVLSASENVEDVRLALEQGASGFIPKSAPAPVLLSALQLVMAGGIYIPPLILAAVAGSEMFVDRAQRMAGQGAYPSKLTDRQCQVLELLVQGKVNKLIARDLGISEGTVKIHLASIYEALRVKNRTEAVIVAQQMGLTGNVSSS